MTKVKKGRVLMNKKEFVKGLTGKAETLLAVVQTARNAETALVYWLEKSDFDKLDDCRFDVDNKHTRYFTGLKSDGVKLTYGTSRKQGGLEWIMAEGHYICELSIADIDAVASANNTDSGHAVEILVGESVLEKELDEKGCDITIKARFTPSRKSTRRAQVKFWRYGCSAHFSEKLAKS